MHSTIPSDHETSLLCALQHPDEAKRNMELRKAILLLPKLHQDIVAYVIAFLNSIAENCEVNKMVRIAYADFFAAV